MAKSTFDSTISWLRSQILLELDRIRTIHGLIPRPSTTVEEIRCFVVMVNDLSNRLGNYTLLLKSMTDAAETSVEADIIVQGTKVLKLLNETLNMTVAVIQIEMQRRGVEAPSIKLPR